MRVIASVEIEADDMRAGNVFVVINGIAITSIGTQEVLKVSEAVKCTSVMGQQVVETPEQVGLAEGIIESSRKLLEWRRNRNGTLRVLHRALAIEEKECLILLDRTAHVSAKLAALKRSGERRSGGQRRRSHTAIPKLSEGVAMQGVRSRFGGDVHRPGGSQFAGHVEAGLADLEFLNRAGWNVG